VNLKQATVIAGIFEFIGAVGLGAAVTSTVRKGIVDWDSFIGEEDILMLGMFSSLLSAALWLAVATKYSLPVSTTQSIVGAIAGFALCFKGPASIHWVGQYDDGKLVKFNGVIFIIVFWVLSPLCSAMISIMIFLPIRNGLLRRPDSFEKTLASWPLFVFVVAFVMAVFLIIKGLQRLDFDYEQQLGLSFAITFAVAASAAFISWIAIVRSGVLRKHVDRWTEPQETEQSTKSEHHIVEKSGENDAQSIAAMVIQNNTETNGAAQSAVEMVEEDGSPSTAQRFLARGKAVATKGVTVDIHDDLGQLEVDIQRNAEQFDPKTDRAFAWLQVCTASLCIFAHGSNDVANAVAPFAAMVSLWRVGEAHDEVAVPEWILLLGAVGMVVGLSSYGYKIMKVIGVRMVPMSCPRGYAIELASSAVVILASNWGFPCSTTHAQVGATVGIGLVELSRPNAELKLSQVVHWKLLGQVMAGWALTLFVSGLTSALIFSLMAYSPYAGGVGTE